MLRHFLQLLHDLFALLMCFAISVIVSVSQLDMHNICICYVQQPYLTMQVYQIFIFGNFCTSSSLTNEGRIWHVWSSKYIHGLHLYMSNINLIGINYIVGVVGWITAQLTKFWTMGDSLILSLMWEKTQIWPFYKLVILSWWYIVA